MNGTFHSPNYPNKYSDGQYCSWRITVSPAQQIHLTFTAFNLQNENNTDALYVFDGENSTGKVLGVFYGSYSPPKEGINSSSNHMFIIFKSDNNGSYTGFSASYSAVNYSGNDHVPLIKQLRGFLLNVMDQVFFPVIRNSQYGRRIQAYKLIGRAEEETFKFKRRYVQIDQ